MENPRLIGDNFAEIFRNSIIVDFAIIPVLFYSKVALDNETGCCCCCCYCVAFKKLLWSSLLLFLLLFLLIKLEKFKVISVTKLVGDVVVIVAVVFVVVALIV